MPAPIPDGDALSLHRPEMDRLSSWVAALNGDVPGRVMALLSAHRELLLISSTEGVAPETRYAIAERLHAAEILTVARRAPFIGLRSLHDAVCNAMPRGGHATAPIAVLIDRAERLAPAMLRRLAALAALQHAGRPVVHVLLIARPTIQPLLHEVGLGALWDDAAAHLRLIPDVVDCLPEGAQGPWRSQTWLPPPRLLASPSTRRLQLPLAAVGCIAAGLGLLTWSLVAPTPPTPTTIRSPAPAATGVTLAPVAAPSARPSAISSLPPPAPGPAAAVLPKLSDSPIHVTVRFDRGDPLAQAQSKWMVAQLLEQGLMADGPLPSPPSRRAGLSYGFPQDEAEAKALARSLHVAVVPGPAGGRPGEISMFVGTTSKEASLTWPQ